VLALEDTAIIYAIRCEEPVAYKFGVSVDPVQRLLELQIANPSKLYLVAECGFSNALDIESRIHNYLSESRIRGEWFLPTDDTLEIVGLLGNISPRKFVRHINRRISDPLNTRKARSKLPLGCQNVEELYPVRLLHGK